MKERLYSKGAFPVLWVSSIALMCVFVQTANTAKTLPILFLAAGVFLFFNRKKLNGSYLKLTDAHEAAYYVAAGIILSVAVVFFFKAWKENETVDTLSAAVGVSANVTVLGTASVLAVLAYPALVYGLKFFLRDYFSVKQTLSRNRHLARPFCILTAVFIFSIIAILRADYIYKDDMQRLVWGNTYYGRESRFAAEFVTIFLHFDRFFADSSPLPQLVQMAVMALACMVVYDAVNPGKRPGFYGIFALLPFALTPYFLECVSFKYDPPQHALAFLFSVIPFLYYRQEERKFLILSVLCMPMVCMFHQVPMAVYPSVVILLCAIDWSRGEKTFREALLRGLKCAAAYLAGMLFYYVFILTPMPGGNNYTSTEFLTVGEMLPGIVRNYLTFFSHILHEFSPVWLALIGLLCILFPLLFAKNSARSKKTAFGLGAAVLLLLLALSYSLYPLLDAPQYAPRHMYSFGLFVGLVALADISFTEQHGVIAKTSVILLGCAFIVFAFIYGNALTQQKEYTEYRIEMVLDTLTEITSREPEQEYTVQVMGTTGYAPTIDAMKGSLAMVRRLVTTSFDEYFSEWWASGLCGYYGLNIVFRNIVTDPDFSRLELPLYEENYYYSVYTQDNRILVVLNDR